MSEVAAIDELRDDGPRAGKRAAPERTCIVSRQARPESDLIRFVLSPASHVVPDLKRRLPGRGVWVTATAEAVDQAVSRKLFARGFRQHAEAPAALAADVASALRDTALGVVGLTRKAGSLASGFTKTEALVRSGKAACVLHATDAAEDGVKKLRVARRRVDEDEGGSVPAWRLFSGEELDRATGLTNVMHAAASDDDQGRRLEVVARRLAIYLGQDAV